jgi:hypothetical protein
MNCIISAPSYSHRSGNIRVLHELCTALFQLCYQASIGFIIEGSQLFQGLKTATLLRSSEENHTLALIKINSGIKKPFRFIRFQWEAL